VAHGRSPGPKNKPNLPAFLGSESGRTLAYAGLATCRESSNVCVMGAVGYPPQLEDRTWALKPTLLLTIAPRRNLEAART